MRAIVLLAALSLLSAPGQAAAADAPRWSQATPFGGNLASLAQAPSAPRLLYALTYSGQIFASRDSGATWGLRGRVSSETYSNMELIVSPSQPETLYAAAANYGVSRSRDGGRHWEPAGSFSIDLHGFAIDREVPSLLYVASFDGLYRSRDSGDTWNLVAFEDLDVDTVAADPRHPGTYFAALEGSPPAVPTTIWRSSDRGETWSQLSSLDLQQSLYRPRFVFDPSRPDVLYFGVSGYGPTFRSGDGGASWSELPGTSNVYWLTAAADGTLFAAVNGQLGVSRSTNQGATWEPPLDATSSAPAPADRITQVVAPSFPQGALFAAGSQGFWTSADSGGSWRASNQGLLGTSYNSILVPPASSPSEVLVAGNDEVFRSTDEGASWNRIHASYEFPSPTVFAAADPLRPEILYGMISSDPNIPLKSTDGGHHWEELPFPYTCGGSLCYVDVTAFLPDPGDPDTIYAAGDYFIHFGGQGLFLLRSPDGGMTWESLHPLPGLRGLLVLPGRKNPLLAGTCKGLFRKEKAGGHWRRVGRGLAPVACNRYTGWSVLAADPRNPRRVYAAGGKPGVFVSDDMGDTFRPLGPGLGTALILQLLVDPQDSSRLYAATSQGIFRWDADRRRWTPLNQGLPKDSNSGILALDPQKPSRLYTSTAQGIFRIDLDGGD